MDAKKFWTISIIAQYDTKIILEMEAYAEMERSFFSGIKDRNVQVFIFCHDKRASKAYIKTVDCPDAKSPFVIIKEIIDPVDFYSGDDLVRFLREYAYPTISSDRGQIVLTWGHNTGMGLFPSDEKFFASAEEELPSIKESEFIMTLKTAAFLKAQLPVANDFITVDEIKNQFHDLFANGKKSFNIEVADNVIKNVLSLKTLKRILEEGIKHVDLLITMNCYMQLFETGLYLSDVVKVMLGPQTAISLFGYNYERLVRLLSSAGPVSVRQVCENICTYYDEKHHAGTVRARAKQLGEVETLCDRVAFSANDLGTYWALRRCIKAIITSLQKVKSKPLMLWSGQKETAESIIFHARQRCLLFFPTKDPKAYVVDFKTFLDNFASVIEMGEFDQFQPVFQRLACKKEKYIIAAHHPAKSFIPSYSQPMLPVLGAQGLSIFFPMRELPNSSLWFSKINFGEMISTAVWKDFLTS